MILKAMRRILDRWYVGMVIVPIILTYLTNYINLPKIFENWEYSIIASLLILTGILIYEIRILSNRITIMEKRPKKSDKRIVRELLDSLNIDKFQEEIVNQDAWNGYKSEDIYRIIDFQDKAKLIGYKTSNEKLNNLIDNFVSKLDDFTEYSSMRVSGRGDWLVPFKDNVEINHREKIKKETDKMNELTKICFEELEKLMEFLRSREFV